MSIKYVTPDWNDPQMRAGYREGWKAALAYVARGGEMELARIERDIARLSDDGGSDDVLGVVTDDDQAAADWAVGAFYPTQGR
jgi:hypothetical protein